MTTDEARIRRGIEKTSSHPIEDIDDLINIITPAIQIERLYYEKQNAEEFVEELKKRQLIFKLRKALEGIWGHDLPVIKDE